MAYRERDRAFRRETREKFGRRPSPTTVSGAGAYRRSALDQLRKLDTEIDEVIDTHIRDRGTW